MALATGTRLGPYEIVALVGAREFPGTEVGDPSPPPFWSPDSRFIAFYAGGKLKKLDVSGGLPQPLCDLPTLPVGGSWNRNGDIIVGNIGGGILRVLETGGTASPVTTLDPSRKEEFHLLPSFLPDGRHFVYLRVAPGTPEHGGVYAGAIDVSPDAQSTTRLMPYVVGLTYAGGEGSEAGRLLFLREGTLLAQRFDAARLALAGEAKPLAARVGSFRDGGFFSASNNGVLVYRAADSDTQVGRLASDFSSGSAATGGATLVSRGGGTAPRWRRDGRELFYLAPDGKMMAVEVTAGQEFTFTAPVSIFQTAPGTTVGDVSADGKRFLLTTPAGPTGSAPFIVVLNWTTALKP